MTALKMAGLAVAAFLSLGQAKPATPLQKALREAENLSINHDRLLASNVLLRNLKKFESMTDAKILEEKLLQLSRLFYTDEGFKNYLSGKELVENQKYADGLDKLHEADEMEKGNIEVLHLMTVAQAQLKKTDLAWTSHKQAFQICPVDLELQKDHLMLLVADEKWQDAEARAEELIKEKHDTSVQTLKEKGLAHLKREAKSDARKAFEGAIQKDPQFPEAYYWLSLIKEKPEAQKLLTKYVNLCKNKTSLHYEREPNLCAKLADAEKRLSL